jgi:hypothetical protein
MNLSAVWYPITKCARAFSKSYCQYYLYKATISIGMISFSLYLYIFFCSVIVSMVSLAYGGEAVYQLVHTWMKKFRSLRRVKMNDQNCRLVQIGKDGFLAQSIDMIVKTEATEHYLLIREIVRVFSEVWSPALTGFFFFEAYAILIYLSVFALYSDDLHAIDWVMIMIFILVRLFILLLYPILSISHANSYLYEIKDMFEGTAFSDYYVLGGREHWIEFVQACPIVWTYYGLWVTYDRLQGLLYTGSAGLIALIASLLSTTESQSDSSN